MVYSMVCSLNYERRVAYHAADDGCSNTIKDERENIESGLFDDWDAKKGTSASIFRYCNMSSHKSQEMS